MKLHHFALIGVLAACGQKAKSPNSATPSEDVAKSAVFSGPFATVLIPEDTLALADEINLYFAQDSAKTLSDSLGVYQFYQATSNRATWVTNPLLDSALIALGDAFSDGLLPTYYDLDSLKRLVDEVKIKSPKDISKLAVIDVLITRALLQFGHDLRYGHVNPKTINPAHNFNVPVYDQPAFAQLIEALKTGSLKQFLNAMRCTHPNYEPMRASLKRYQQFVNDGGWQVLDWGELKKIEPGDTHALMPLLRLRLAAEGFFDTTGAATITEYDKPLQRACASFQLKHGLAADSIIGKATMALLNISAEKKLATIACNMERLRWGVAPFKGTFIWVNAPSYQLQYFKEDSLVWTSEVIIGKQTTQTLAFQSAVTSLVLNPTWTVPYSISSQEILPILKKNQNHLANQNMVLMQRSGEMLDPTTIDFSGFDAQSFPYIIRQQPGDKNALGRIKFLMPNPHYIYIHDTPSKNLFKRSERALSHGCIRLNKPFELATLLLSNQADWHLEAIMTQVKTKETYQIKLDAPVPVYISYLTHYTTQSGEAYFFADVYAQDDRLIHALSL